MNVGTCLIVAISSLSKARTHTHIHTLNTTYTNDTQLSVIQLRTPHWSYLIYRLMNTLVCRLPQAMILPLLVCFLRIVTQSFLWFCLVIRDIKSATTSFLPSASHHNLSRNACHSIFALLWTVWDKLKGQRTPSWHSGLNFKTNCR